MSEDMNNKQLVGVTLPPQIIEKIDERATLTGANRQDVIKGVLISAFFPID